MHTATKIQPIKEGLQLEPSEMTEGQRKLLEWDRVNGFDTRVHITDPRSGQLIKYQPYRRQVNSEGVIYFRRDESGGPERRFAENGLPLDPPAKEVKNRDQKLS